MNRATTDVEDPEEEEIDLLEEAEDEGDGFELDDLLEEGEEEASGVLDPAAPLVAPTFEDRVNRAIDTIGADRETYLAQLETLAADPDAGLAPAAPAESVEDEAGRILSADPVFMRAYNRVVAGVDSFATQDDYDHATLAVRGRYDGVIATVTAHRTQTEAARISRTSAERDALSRVSEHPRFSGYLKEPGERRALLQYARKHGIGDMEVAARAYFSDREFDRGRKTQTRAVRGSVPTSSGGGSGKPAASGSTREVKAPDHVIDGPLDRYVEWQMKHNMPTIRRRLGGRGRL